MARPIDEGSDEVRLDVLDEAEELLRVARAGGIVVEMRRLGDLDAEVLAALLAIARPARQLVAEAAGEPAAEMSPSRRALQAAVDELEQLNQHRQARREKGSE